jgi:hypothetical protein
MRRIGRILVTRVPAEHGELLDDGLLRSYSFACLPDHGELELHVRRIGWGGRCVGGFGDSGTF